MVQVQITDPRPDDEQAMEQIAALLARGFREHWPAAWPDMHAALTEVAESFGEGRISRVARDTEGSVVGWIGGIPQYDGNVWELHPLVLHEDWQGKGVGRALVADLEEHVRMRDRKSTRLNSSHANISYAVFCLKKKKKN